jgi:hypothetical protein
MNRKLVMGGFAALAVVAFETVADATVYYLKLTPEPTTFTNHGMHVPQLLILKVSNDIQLEADLVLVLAP